MDAIHFLDVRNGGPVAHAQARIDAATALRKACLGAAAPVGRLCLPSIDRIAANWLKRSASAYRAELERIVAILGFPGAMTLNMSYLFACTTQAYEDEHGLPRLRRTLDWPFQGLGRGVEIALQSGAGRRILQRHLAGGRGRAQRDGSRPLLRLDQSGADEAAHPGLPRLRL